MNTDTIKNIIFSVTVNPLLSRFLDIFDVDCPKDGNLLINSLRRFLGDEVKLCERCEKLSDRIMWLYEAGCSLLKVDREFMRKQFLQDQYGTAWFKGFALMMKGIKKYGVRIPFVPAAPFLIDKTHGHIGIVAFLGGEEALAAVLADTSGLGDKGRIYLVDEHGCQIEPWQGPLRRLERPLDPAADIPPSSPVGTPAVLTYRDRNGTKVLAVREGVPGLGWTLVVEVDERAALSPAYREASLLPVSYTHLTLPTN